MTLQEIFDLLNEHTQDDILRLPAGVISSPEIDGIFEDYLLNEDLVITGVEIKLNTTSVTVEGKGDSLLFFDTHVDTLIFTVTAGVPSMAITAYAIIKDEDGWSFGHNFHGDKNGTWSGYFNLAASQLSGYNKSFFTVQVMAAAIAPFLNWIKMALHSAAPLNWKECWRIWPSSV